MKKLMTLILGLTFLTTTVVCVSAQDTTKKAKNKQKKTKGKTTGTKE
ncbi:MAG TPA: hypothetical protein VKB88_33215 [Bryobacteraceae bacterium]|nr:hypothetical protein [Bryobacteraceae bacterium]